MLSRSGSVFKVSVFSPLEAGCEVGEVGLSEASPRRKHGSPAVSSAAAPQHGRRPTSHTPRPTPRPVRGHRHVQPEPHGIRLPIAIKYGVVSALLLIASMVFLGSSVYFVSVRTADREINDKGIKAALLVATSIDPVWADDERSNDEKSRAQIRVGEQLRDFHAQKGAEGVLDIVIFEDAKPDSKYVEAASGSNRLDWAAGDLLESAEADRAGVVVRAGELEGSAFRSYGAPLLLGDERAGYVRVFISAAEIDKLRGELMQSVTLMTLLALLVSIGVGILVGSLLTRPVRVLKSDMAIVARGDLSHKSAVRTGDELEALAHAFNRMTTHLAEAQELEASRKALERELAIATRIQNALLPDEVPEIPGYQLATYYESAKEVGGDYYDFIEIGQNRYGVVVADVSGKGIPGSLVMTMTRSLIRMAARDSGDPARILGRANASLFTDMTRGMFVTCIYCDFDANRGTVAVGRAGHNAAYHYRAAEARLDELQPGGIALGFDPGATFDQNLEIAEYALQPGDFLVLYTDGIIEAMDPEQNEYTPERFAAVLEACHEYTAEEIVATVLADVEEHAQGAEPSDDITLVIIKRD